MVGIPGRLRPEPCHKRVDEGARLSGRNSWGPDGIQPRFRNGISGQERHQGGVGYGVAEQVGRQSSDAVPRNGRRAHGFWTVGAETPGDPYGGESRAFAEPPDVPVGNGVHDAIMIDEVARTGGNAMAREVIGTGEDR